MKDDSKEEKKLQKDEVSNNEVQDNETSSEQLDFSEMEDVEGGSNGCGFCDGQCQGPDAGCGVCCGDCKPNIKSVIKTDDLQ